MTIRKTKSGKWTVDVSNGFHPVTQKKEYVSFEKD